ncbi:MAG: hypothetical protein IJG42_00215 [Muribaculaceae bacterium]|nr:hypothetical protein [Muribaculaceae bacterium]
MNKNHHITTQAELEELIERYFDGDTSVLEEQMLRETLADCPWSSEVIDEARFTMGYFAAHSHEGQRVARKNNRNKFIGIAASIAIVLAAGGYALWHQQQSAGVCIAYVNGQIVQDDDKVMALIVNDLSMMDNAADAMTDQLSSLGAALELDNE